MSFLLKLTEAGLPLEDVFVFRGKRKRIRSDLNNAQKVAME